MTAIQGKRALPQVFFDTPATLVECNERRSDGSKSMTALPEPLAIRPHTCRFPSISRFNAGPGRSPGVFL